MGAVVGSTVSGRVVVITGGGTGIGAAIAERYAAEGAHVVVVGRRPEPLHEVERAVGALPIIADAADTASAKAAVADVLARFGRIDVLVANAGGHGFSPVGRPTTRAGMRRSARISPRLSRWRGRHCPR